jgi:type I protein arginine methyltransferase
LLPDKASLSICGIEDEKYKNDKINWWNRVWGFDMGNIRDIVRL